VNEIGKDLKYLNTSVLNILTNSTQVITISTYYTIKFAKKVDTSCAPSIEKITSERVYL